MPRPAQLPLALALLMGITALGPLGAARGAEGSEECEESGPTCVHRTSTLLSASPNPSSPGQTVLYTATVSYSPSEGTVAFSDLGVPIGTCEAVAVHNGTATCPVSYPAAGVHTIQASYSGGSSFRGSHSPLYSQDVEASPSPSPTIQPTVTLSSSKNPSRPHQSVTYTATIAPAPPGGDVEFIDSGATVPECRTVEIAPLGSQSATAACRVSYERTGDHQIRAIFSGAGSYPKAESAVLEQHVSGQSNALLAQLSGRPSVHHGLVSARVRCISLAGGCKISARLTTTVSFRHERPVAVSAARRRRSITLGSENASIGSGKSLTITIEPNAASRRLAARFRRLPAMLTIAIVSAEERTSLPAVRLTIPG